MVDIWMIIALVGGLGLFLYGMKLMSEGLEAMAGDKLRDGLSKLTENRFAAVAVGAGVTAVIQSSSATSVMVVGFVNAGLMTLAQAINVCMGANIGTTITAQIVAINITQYAPAILFAGVLMMFFGKKRAVQRAGQIIGGLGFIFYGMAAMSAAMAPLRDNPQFIDLLAACREPWIGIVAGILVTAILQSSSAMMGIIQAFAMQNILDLSTSVYLILGLNIGACVTPILAALGGSRTAKRTAIGILAFNIIGAAVFAVLANTTGVVDWVASWTPDEPVKQLANFHTLFNLLTTVVFLFLPNALPYIAMKLVPGEDKSTEGRRLKFLAEPLPNSPTVIVGLATKETARMMEIATTNFEDAVQSFVTENADDMPAVLDKEQTVNYLYRAITDEMTRVSGYELSPVDTERVTQILHSIMNIERISDIAVNIAELAQKRADGKGKMDRKAVTDLEGMYKRVDQSLKDTTKVLNEDSDASSAGLMAISLEDEVDTLEKKMKKSYVKRLKKGECTATASMLFTDCVTMMERIADHSANIATVFLKGDG